MSDWVSVDDRLPSLALIGCWFVQAELLWPTQKKADSMKYMGALLGILTLTK